MSDKVDALLPTITDSTGVVRKLGRLKPDAKKVSKIRRVTDTLPKSAYTEFRDETDLKVKDQSSSSGCNGHACATGVEAIRWTGGLPYVPLSAWYPYSIMCDGVDQGSYIADALKQSEQGIAPESLVPYGTINPRSLSRAAREAAPRFRAEIGGRLEEWEEIETAVQMHQPVNLSIRVGSNFNNLDAEGVPGYSRGAGNHAVCAFGGYKVSKKHGGLILVQNSWSPGWGLRGYFWMSRRFWDDQAYREAYTLVAPEEDPQDPTRPK